MKKLKGAARVPRAAKIPQVLPAINYCGQYSSAGPKSCANSLADKVNEAKTTMGSFQRRKETCLLWSLVITPDHLVYNIHFAMDRYPRVPPQEEMIEYSLSDSLHQYNHVKTSPPLLVQWWCDCDCDDLPTE